MKPITDKEVHTGICLCPDCRSKRPKKDKKIISKARRRGFKEGIKEEIE